jgi:hypothetical protein
MRVAELHETLACIPNTFGLANTVEEKKVRQFFGRKEKP